MNSKPPPKKNPKPHDKNNSQWKRKRPQNPNSSSNSSNPRTPKKPKHSHPTPSRAPSQTQAQGPATASAPAQNTPHNTTSNTTTISWPSTIPPSQQTPSTSPVLTTSHTPLNINIISSTSIQKKVKAVLNHLIYPAPEVMREKPPVVVLSSKAKVAAKMISVVEIVKREIAKEEGGGKWWAYCAVREEVVEVVREKERKDGKGKGKGIGIEGEGVGGREDGDEDVPDTEDGDDNIEEAFEVMKTPFERSLEGKPKVRAMPVMVIYLARVKIEELSRIYGEQTNAMGGK